MGRAGRIFGEQRDWLVLPASEKSVIPQTCVSRCWHKTIPINKVPQRLNTGRHRFPGWIVTHNLNEFLLDCKR